MADISIKCPRCDEVLTVSEFVDPSSINCAKCATPLEKPQAAGKPKKMPTVKMPKPDSAPAQSDQRSAQTQLTQKNEAVAQQPFTNPEHANSSTVRATTKMKKGRQKVKVSNHMKAWLLFLGLGASMGYMRYGNVLSESSLDTFNFASPYVFGVLHVAICLTICKESVFHGVLCILIPPYMLYHLFANSDNFYLRAVVGGLLIGMGQETFLFWQEQLGNAVQAADDWIHNPYNK